MLYFFIAFVKNRFYSISNASRNNQFMSFVLVLLVFSFLCLISTTEIVENFYPILNFLTKQKFLF